MGIISPALGGAAVAAEASAATREEDLSPAGAGDRSASIRPSDHAHLRLGFSDRQIAEWFEEAGLDLEETQDFDPRGTAEAKLTVKLWLGRDRRMLIADPTVKTSSARETA